MKINCDRDIFMENLSITAILFITIICTFINTVTSCRKRYALTVCASKLGRRTSYGNKDARDNTVQLKGKNK